MSLVGLLTATGKQVHLGQLHMRPIQWHLENNWRVPRVTRKGDPSPQIAPFPSKVVARGKQCAARSTITPSRTCSANIYRCIKRRVGLSLRRAHCKGNFVPSRKQFTHKPSRAKAVFLAPEEFRTLYCNKTVLIATDNTTVVTYINKEGGYEVGLSVCPTVENPVLVYQAASNPQGTSHPRPAERDSRQAIQA